MSEVRLPKETTRYTEDCITWTPVNATVLRPVTTPRYCQTRDGKYWRRQPRTDDRLGWSEVTQAHIDMWRKDGLFKKDEIVADNT